MNNRRHFLASAASLLCAGPVLAGVTAPAIHVVKDPNCGCCTAWIDILGADGFTVTTELSSGTKLMQHKIDSGIPRAMTSCHTAHAEGYVVEGHVPPADIRRLLQQRPDAVGISVPGMPHGSPGMGPEATREAYDVLLILKDGSVEVYAHYDAA